MKIQSVKGTRDFYPAEMAVRNFIIDGWKAVSLRNGFEEYDSPILEHLKMFQIKSGDEIVEQLFSLKDRGGRDLALIPEMTPSLARMVNQRINSLPKPIKWFSVPRLFRAERPQKGRLREFFQWNIDIIGTDDVLADAEIIFTTIDYLMYVGLKPDDVVVKISSRKLLSAVLKSLGIPDKDLDAMYTLLDKKAKLPSDTFKQILNEKVNDKEASDKIIDFMETKEVSEIKKVININDEIEQALDELALNKHYLNEMGVSDFCRFDAGIVRGLAYYTGIVFEVCSADEELRAICGGGRYDNLLKDFGGPDVPATGMGMGDCVLEIVLREKGLLQKEMPTTALDFFVVAIGDETDEAVRLTARLRRLGYKTDFSLYKKGGLAKQLKEAARKNTKKCIIIGEELRDKNLVIKDMMTGDQQLVQVEKFLKELNSPK